MDICQVQGNVVSTNKVDQLVGKKLMIVTPLNMSDMRSNGAPYVAVDTVSAGISEIVIVVKGSSARQTPETEGLPIDAVIVGIVDTIEIGNQMTYKKFGERG